MTRLQEIMQEEAICYLTECTLATVEKMAMWKNPPKGELRRQMNIAQYGVSFIHNAAMRASNRVLDVISDHRGNVSEWVKTLK